MVVDSPVGGDDDGRPSLSGRGKANSVRRSRTNTPPRLPAPSASIPIPTSRHPPPPPNYKHPSHASNLSSSARRHRAHAQTAAPRGDCSNGNGGTRTADTRNSRTGLAAYARSGASHDVRRHRRRLSPLPVLCRGMVLARVPGCLLCRLSSVRRPRPRTTSKFGASHLTAGATATLNLNVCVPLPPRFLSLSLPFSPRLHRCPLRKRTQRDSTHCKSSVCVSFIFTCMIKT